MKVRPAVGWLLAYSGGVGFFAWAIEAASRRGGTAHSAPIMIGGFLVAAVGLVVVFRLPAVQARKVEFGANLRRAEGMVVNASSLSSVGWLLSMTGSGIVNVGGMILAAAGTIMLTWCFLRAIPTHHADPGMDEASSPQDPPLANREER